VAPVRLALVSTSVPKRGGAFGDDGPKP